MSRSRWVHIWTFFLMFHHKSCRYLLLLNKSDKVISISHTHHLCCQSRKGILLNTCPQAKLASLNFGCKKCTCLCLCIRGSLCCIYRITNHLYRTYRLDTRKDISPWWHLRIWTRDCTLNTSCNLRQRRHPHNPNMRNRMAHKALLFYWDHR